MTAQVMDNFLYEGEMTSMAAEPLVPFLKSRQIAKFTAPDSTCWRGYMATWELRGKHLFMIDFYGFIESETTVGMTYLFGNENAVHAVWFSGNIRVPQGELLYYIHGGYGSIYEQDVVLSFEKGVLTNRQCMDNKERANRKEEEDGYLPF